MTNRELYRYYLRELQSLYSSNEAAIITDWTFTSIAGLNRSDIVKNPADIIDEEKLQRLNEKLAALLQQKPIQYVLGEAWFYKMKFLVNENVLIPRPETEELVQLVVAGHNDKTEIKNPETGQPDSFSERHPLEANQVSILDIGTGSGCIAIAIKKNLPEISMTAMDVSTDALEIAKQNAKAHNTTIDFLELDFLEEGNWSKLDRFDVIVSNPPYIPLNEKDKLDNQVILFEPHAALFVPDDEPMLFYKKIADFGIGHLKCNGKIYVELHEGFTLHAIETFEKKYDVEVKADLFGKQRMLIAKRK